MSLPIELREDANRQQLEAGLSRILDLLRRTASSDAAEPADIHHDDIPVPQALQRLCAFFGLSTFERDLLLLCAGVELRSDIANACAAAHNDPRARFATFGLALATLPEAHWSAVSPDRPLRRWRLLELLPGDTLINRPLRIDERILHYIAEVPCADQRLASLVRVAPQSTGALSKAQAECANALSRYWTGQAGVRSEIKPVLLVGRSSFEQCEVAQRACADLEWQLSIIDLYHFSSDQAQRSEFARLWNREALLSCSALLIRTGDLDGAEPLRWLRSLLDQLQVPVAVEVREGSEFERLDGLRIIVPPLDASQSRQLWAESLGPMAARLNGSLDRIVEQFRFDGGEIRFAGALARDSADAGEPHEPDSLAWEICRNHARRSLQHLATRIEPKARWEDLVLPPMQLDTLLQIAAHVRQRSTVNLRWGFAERYSRGLGATALFAGSSGTGKTMAAEVVAADLQLDLYRIDLASVVSKYIGETEKNLRRIFDAAEESGAVLLFDEADALFGKRSEVRDSHDRYANIEISYLLQRMEAYSGLAILTTNMKSALDEAFLRRIRFIVQFPFPDAAGRQLIWERVFPDKTPLEKLDYAALAKLNVSGGVIRNIATHAAFLAADEDHAVSMDTILRAARVEYAKLERPLTAAETGGWV